jgi:hypothetical protein
VPKRELDGKPHDFGGVNSADAALGSNRNDAIKGRILQQEKL